MHQHEITWTQTLYPQYQVYEHRLNSFSDRLQPILLHQNEVTLAKVGLFYSGNGVIVICAFCGIHLYRWLPNDDTFTEHKKFSKNRKFISLLQDVNHQSTIQYHGSFMKITNVCYNVFHNIRSTFLSFKNLIYFYFHKRFCNKFCGVKFHSLCKIYLIEGSKVKKLSLLNRPKKSFFNKLVQ